MNRQLCLECREAEEESGIDINRLLNELALIKGKGHPTELSEKETLYLCLSLCGCSNSETAYRYYLDRKPNEEELACQDYIKRLRRNMNAEMSDKVNGYIKELMGIEANKYKPTWSKVRQFLSSHGYARPQNSPQVQPKDMRKAVMIVELQEIVVEDVRKTLEDKYGININILQVLDIK
ncbi:MULTISPECIES: hypothetical protein [unclassified Coleofasciculus]|uniref:hypothetical protein n=1 Tax=unclassified Coleofasciculus TaxID=2692782 RepID=UPI0018825650|nr:MULTISPECIES: hypothetical protein [unclassified Coleofasciculus]MBE9128554.1 hypothetical protein [Coleofasciculus sp. LEGE 07081]MBE9149366.1 hypothetical protein [Coleofasciculus sp. LEGE 07092]